MGTSARSKLSGTRPSIHRFVVSVGMAFLVVASVGHLASAYAAECKAELEPANLDFTLKDMHGNDVKLSEYLGNVILLDFWATWCAPCRIEIPGFIEFLDEFEAQGFSVLGVSIDDPPDSLRFYAEELGMDYPVLIGDGRDDVKDAFGPLVGFPTTFIIDRDGMICHKHTGYSPKEQFDEEIRALLSSDTERGENLRD